MLALAVEDQPHSTLPHFGENLFVVLLMMLHPTQELESPANPARFIVDSWGTICLERELACEVDVVPSRFCTASGARLSDPSFEGDGAFPSHAIANTSDPVVTGGRDDLSGSYLDALGLGQILPSVLR